MPFTLLNNAIGINPPKTTKYNYRLNDDLSLNSREWLLKATEHKGSWWDCWLNWLIKSNAELVKSLDYKNLISIEEAPGSYVKK